MNTYWGRSTLNHLKAFKDKITQDKETDKFITSAVKAGKNRHSGIVRFHAMSGGYSSVIIKSLQVC